MARRASSSTTEDEALAAVRRLPLIDRRGVRAQFERRFTASVMARDSLKLLLAAACQFEPAGWDAAPVAAA